MSGRPPEHPGAAAQRRRRARSADLLTRPCAYCQRDPGADGSLPTRDHVIPLARGGTWHHLNLLPACSVCNAEKGNQTAIEWAIVLAHVGDYSRAQRALGAQARADRLARKRTPSSVSVHSGLSPG